MTMPLEYTLGLDLGAASIGWAAIQTSAGNPARLLRAGVRVFEPGVEGDLEHGRAEPRNRARRAARQARRLTDRTRRRIRKVFHILQRASLLPPGEPHEVIPALDRESFKRYREAMPDRAQKHRLAQVLPLWLRAQALNAALPPDELGRAIFHLAHRRGFLSSRRTQPKEGEDQGQLKREIGELDQAIKASHARTLGEYLATLDPEEARIRTRKTSRAMYREEFQAIWETQRQFHPQLLTDDLRTRLEDAIFFQRPLKSVAHLIGTCELQPTRRRAPWALLEAQRFRMLQMVNNTRLVDLRTGEERPLAPEERATLLAHLDRHAALSFAEAKRLIGRKPAELRFNLEQGGETRFIGNRTAAALAGVFGESWWTLSADEQRQVVTDVLTIDSEPALARRGRNHWRLSGAAADAFAVVRLEPGYCSFSRAALAKLMPYMEGGMSTSEACDAAYPERRALRQPLDALPPVTGSLKGLRNPVVARVLTELRKVVNALVRQYGKPARIRIELARDVKRSNRARAEASKRMRMQESRRAHAMERLRNEAGIGEPSRTDIEKMLLWEECGGHCPYTGRSISFAALFGADPQFDVEHIIPFHRSFDNSFVNKTLCYVDENRRVKCNRTPWEAFGHRPEYAEILDRVRAFRGDKAREKLRRFQLQEIESLDDFTTRELNDTRWAARLAADYVSALFGGRVDEGGSLRVQVTSGQLTAYLRGALELHGLLSQGDVKSRADHRHHAVDAIVVALTTPDLVRRLAETAEKTWAQRRRLFSSIEPPWPDFRSSVGAALAPMIVSHHPDRRVRGALHEETLYGRGPSGAAVVRKAVHLLRPKDMDRIVDEKVGAVVQAKAAAVGGPQRLESDPPLLGRTPIRKVRIARNERVVGIGEGRRHRLVIEGSNHHIEILAELDQGGEERRWFGRVVSTLEANRRLRARPLEAIVDRGCGPGQRFKFSLCRGDALLLRQDEHERLWLVQKISVNQRGATHIVLKPPADARPVREIPTHGRIHSPNTLFRHSARKVTVDPLGTLRDARD